MSTRYAVEAWSACRTELAALFVRAWAEVEADDVGGWPLAPDWDQYAALDAAGFLQVVTARKAGMVIGYHVSMVCPHLHYQGMLAGATDSFYVCPEARQGWTASRLMRAVEAAWKARGVYFAATMTKLSCERGAFFERLGYHPSERLYFKVLGEERAHGRHHRTDEYLRGEAPGRCYEKSHAAASASGPRGQ